MIFKLYHSSAKVLDLASKRRALLDLLTTFPRKTDLFRNREETAIGCLNKPRRDDAEEAIYGCADRDGGARIGECPQSTSFALDRSFTVAHIGTCGCTGNGSALVTG
jgi:hypothetical protein